MAVAKSRLGLFGHGIHGEHGRFSVFYGESRGFHVRPCSERWILSSNFATAISGEWRKEWVRIFLCHTPPHSLGKSGAHTSNDSIMAACVWSNIAIVRHIRRELEEAFAAAALCF